MNKNFRAIVVGIGLVAISQYVSAEVISEYTELSSENCRTLSATEEPDAEYYSLRCNGPAGYELVAYYDDSRASVSVVSPDGIQYDLNYWSVITRYFSSLGPRAEWRVKKEEANWNPIALIVRVIANENPDKPEKTTSYLAVAKLTDEGICVTDRFKATGKENIEARIAADTSAGKGCLGPAPF